MSDGVSHTHARTTPTTQVRWRLLQRIHVLPERLPSQPASHEVRLPSLVSFVCATPHESGTESLTLLYPCNYRAKHRHPNVYPDGTVCISILHPPVEDKFGYEQSCERWSPVQSVEKIILSVISMLAEPNDESPANIDAAKMWRSDRDAFNRKCDECVRKSLGWL